MPRPGGCDREGGQRVRSEDFQFCEQKLTSVSLTGDIISKEHNYELSKRANHRSIVSIIRDYITQNIE